MHTKEPWVAVSGDEAEVGYERQWPVVTSLDGEIEIIGTEGFYLDLELSKANARRVVACVNACAGIPTEELELVEIIELPNPTYSILKQQCDDLLSALKKIQNEPNETLSNGKALIEIMRIAKSAIKKAELSK